MTFLRTFALTLGNGILAAFSRPSLETVHALGCRQGRTPNLTHASSESPISSIMFLIRTDFSATSRSRVKVSLSLLTSVSARLTHADDALRAELDLSTHDDRMNHKDDPSIRSRLRRNNRARSPSREISGRRSTQDSMGVYRVVDCGELAMPT